MSRRAPLVLVAAIGLAVGLFGWLLQGRRTVAPGPVEGPAEGVVREPVGEARMQSDDGGVEREATTPVAHRELGPSARGAAGWLLGEGPTDWKGAWVALAAHEPGTIPVLLEQRPCDAQGGFRVSTERPGRLLLVVTAPGFVPRTVELDPEAGREHAVDGLRLERGAALAGRITSHSRALARFEVVAVNERDGPRLHTFGGELLWTGSAMEWCFTTAESDEQGAYSISGLRPGAYRVGISTCRGPMAGLCSRERDFRQVHAPAAGVDFDFEAGALALRFTHGGQPLGGVDVELVAGGWRSGKRCDAQGECVFQLVPRLECDLIATKHGFEELRLPVNAPASGANAVASFEMREKAPPPSLRLVVSHAGGEVPATIRVRLLEPGARALPSNGEERRAAQAEEARALLQARGLDVEPDPRGVQVDWAGVSWSDPTRPGHAVLATQRSDRTLACTPETRDAAVKEFVFEGVPPGPYRVVLLAGPSLASAYAATDEGAYIGRHCWTETLAMLPKSGELRLAFQLENRPALRLELRGPEGAYVSGRVTLRDPAGDEIPIVLYDPRRGLVIPDRELAVDGPTLLYSALCAGRGQLEVARPGGSLVRQPVEFVPGQVLAVELAR